MSGPPPKREDERRRRNKPADGAEITKITAIVKVKQPSAKSTWHPTAKKWYKSLAKSGQAQFYEPSDWEYAQFTAELMTRQLKTRGQLSAQMIQNITAMMNDLLTTEGARRRARMEIDRRAEVQKKSVTALAEYRKTIGK